MTTPISILASALPRVGAREVEATRSVLAGLGATPTRVDAVVPGLGTIAISLLGSADGPFRSPDGPSFGLSRGSVVGRLSLDGGLARRLVARALGVESEGALSVRRMGLGERGLLAGLVAALFHEVRVPLSVSVTPPEGDEGRAFRGVALDLAIDVAGATGFARLEIPPAWLDEAAASDEACARLADLSVEVSVERARTFLAAHALDDLEEGDAVVFDGERADGDGAWSGRLTLGGYASRVEVRVDGRVIVREEFRRVGPDASPARVTTPRETTMDVTGTTESSRDKTAVLAAAPIEVIAEVGRITLRGDEVLGLAPGAVLTLGGTRSTCVALRVAGEVWAEGELVDVDGELGVRVTRAFRR